MAIIHESKHVRVIIPEKPHISRVDGGHIILALQIDVEDRTKLSPEQAVELMKFTMVVGESMKTVLAKSGIDIGRINYQDNGNWTPSLHIHVYGRAKGATKQKYGTPLLFPATLEEFNAQHRENFEVFTPQMPNKQNARYEEWRIWFERMTPFLGDGVVFVGHSLGGIFLVKYLSENMFPKKIKAVILVAAPFKEVVGKESMGDFALPSSITNFSKQAGKIYLLYSKNDPIVPFEALTKYERALSGAKTKIFEDKGHFNIESFPEIIEIIKSL